jgi:twitching motility protein PilU
LREVTDHAVGEDGVVAGLSLSLHDAPTPEEVEAIRREELRKQQEKREELELARLQAAKQAQSGNAPG